MKTATLIKKLPNFTGEAALYQLSEPLDGHDYVAVSATVAMFSGSETYIFPANADGEVTDWGELDGSQKGTLSHSVALADAGYVLN